MTDLVVLPLYPQFSISTSGSSLRLLQQMFEADPELDGLRHCVIASWRAPTCRRALLANAQSFLERLICNRLGLRGSACGSPVDPKGIWETVRVCVHGSGGLHQGVRSWRRPR